MLRPTIEGIVVGQQDDWSRVLVLRYGRLGKGRVMSGEEEWIVRYQVEDPAGHFAEHELSVPFPTADIVIALEFAQREIPKEYPNTSYEVIMMVRGDGSGIRGRLEALRPTDSL